MCCILKKSAIFSSSQSLIQFCVNDCVGMNMPSIAIINFSLTVIGTALLILLQPGCSKPDTLTFQGWIYYIHFQMLVFSLSSDYSNYAFRILRMSRCTLGNSTTQLLAVQSSRVTAARPDDFQCLWYTRWLLDPLFCVSVASDTRSCVGALPVFF